MEKEEARLKAAAMKELRQQCPSFVVLEYATAGAPDRTIVGCGVQSNWEFKHSAPGFKTHGIQELTMLRLAACGHARYIIFEEKRGIRRTLIVHPRHVGSLTPEAWTVGFDHRWLVARIREVHGL